MQVPLLYILVYVKDFIYLYYRILYFLPRTGRAVYFVMKKYFENGFFIGPAFLLFLETDMARIKSGVAAVSAPYQAVSDMMLIFLFRF